MKKPPSSLPLLDIAPFSDEDLSAAVEAIAGDEGFVETLLWLHKAFRSLVEEDRLPLLAETLQDFLDLFSTFSDAPITYPVSRISPLEDVLLRCLCRFGFLEILGQQPTINVTVRVPRGNYEVLHGCLLQLLRHLRIESDADRFKEMTWVAVNKRLPVFSERLLQLLTRMRRDVPEFDPEVEVAIAALRQSIRAQGSPHFSIDPHAIN